jgi:hypothetical protein
LRLAIHFVFGFEDEKKLLLLECDCAADEGFKDQRKFLGFSFINFGSREEFAFVPFGTVPRTRKALPRKFLARVRPQHWRNYAPKAASNAVHPHHRARKKSRDPPWMDDEEEDAMKIRLRATFARDESQPSIFHFPAFSHILRSGKVFSMKMTLPAISLKALLSIARSHITS